MILCQDCVRRALNLLSFAAVEATLKFTYVEKYPDEPPLWEIYSQENLEDSDAEDVLALLQQQVCQSLLYVVYHNQRRAAFVIYGSIYGCKICLALLKN